MSNKKIDPKNIHLEIDSIEWNSHGMAIHWSSDIGFGEYSIYEKDGTLCGYSECMDRGDDKEFLTEVLKKAAGYIVDTITIEG